ncbi:hypothetical protein BofuT4_uP132510.1 [Botrytis cinerea T4]|uniref:Uncharacterized protein n=1 Tax=Botryotinia fuckeliana (strain T4) TaxID=999810 RepID=G2YR23_BOTF4|nr:hypothetical protein BofuT4_uP132510.1 [Botrytis cinerea T4]
MAICLLLLTIEEFVLADAPNTNIRIQAPKAIREYLATECDTKLEILEIAASLGYMYV